jgi:hypothetical protein
MNVIHCSKEGGHYLFYLSSIAKHYPEPLCWSLTENHIREIKALREGFNDIFLLCDREICYENISVRRVIYLENSINYIMKSTRFPSRYIAYNFGEKWIEKVLYEWFYLLLKAKKNTEKLFLLGGQRLYLSSKKQVFLPDPVPESSFDGRNEERMTRLVILLIGSISKRKGVNFVLNLAKRLEHDKRFQFRIVGQFSNDCNDVLEQFSNYPNVLVDNRWLNEEDFHVEVRNSNALILPYSRLNTSSGILGYGCLYRKPVITFQRGAHIPRLVEKYNLGTFISEKSLDLEEDFDRLFVNYLQIVDSMKSIEYIKDNSIKKFVKTILDE